ncbi:MAG: glycosyltransferase family 1 protein [Methylotenera sp.]|nr:glycosyltransferase family 1 protein [Methylotenera sp.]
MLKKIFDMLESTKLGLRFVTKRMTSVASAYHKVTGIVVHFGFYGLLNAWRHNIGQARLEGLLQHQPINKIVILTVPHTLYVAKMIAYALLKINIQTVIIHKKPKEGFESCLHIVITSHAFRHMPQTYFVYQMEQSVATRWFRPKHRKKLYRAAAIMDYSQANIAFLHQHQFEKNQVYFMPVSFLLGDNAHLDAPAYDYDVLFYGSTKNKRRQAYLHELSKHFNVKVINNLYGDDISQTLKRAKIVVNIHFYENALLETTRIFECISTGVFVISEESADIMDHQDLLSEIAFVPVGDIQAMINSVTYWLAHDADRILWLKNQHHRLQVSNNQFESHFYGFLTNQGIIKNS